MVRTRLEPGTARLRLWCADTLPRGLQAAWTCDLQIVRLAKPFIHTASSLYLSFYRHQPAKETTGGTRKRLLFCVATHVSNGHCGPKVRGTRRIRWSLLRYSTGLHKKSDQLWQILYFKSSLRGMTTFKRWSFLKIQFKASVGRVCYW